MNHPEGALKFSVVIPAKNASKTIGRCLDAIYSNNNVDFEVMVVDDGCTDDTIEVASKYKLMVLKNSVHSGVSGARNTGAFASKADVLVFIDADIVVPEKSLLKISEKMRSKGVDAVVGMLAEKTGFNNFFSQYKNLWMQYTFGNLPDNISLIFSSIAAIKKDAFLRSGGFDINYKSPNVEDNELGIRLCQLGNTIILDKTLQVEHLKYYNFFSLLRTHYFRAKGLIKLFYRSRPGRLFRVNPTSVPNMFIFNIPLAISLVFLLISFPVGNNLSLKIIMASLLFLLFILVNYGWFSFLNKKRGAFFALKSLFYLPIEFIAILSGLAAGQIEYLTGSRY